MPVVVTGKLVLITEAALLRTSLHASRNLSTLKPEARRAHEAPSVNALTARKPYAEVSTPLVL